MIYLPFEKYIIEQGFIPHESNEEFNVLTCPRHYFQKDGISLSIDFRARFFSPLTRDLKDFTEVLYTVNYKGLSYIMPVDPRDFRLLFKGEIKTVWEVLWPTLYQQTIEETTNQNK